MRSEQALKAQISLKKEWYRHPSHACLLYVNSPLIYGHVEFPMIKAKSKKKKKNLAWFKHHPYDMLALSLYRGGPAGQEKREILPKGRFSRSCIWLFTTPEKRWPEVQIYGVARQTLSPVLVQYVPEQPVSRNMKLYLGSTQTSPHQCQSTIPWHARLSHILMCFLNLLLLLEMSFDFPLA